VGVRGGQIYEMRHKPLFGGGSNNGSPGDLSYDDPNDLFENDIITPQTPIYFAFLSSSRPAGLTKRDFFRINFKGNKGKNLDFHSSETRNT
jgi:hypothetical protein